MGEGTGGVLLDVFLLRDEGQWLLDLRQGVVRLAELDAAVDRALKGRERVVEVIFAVPWVAPHAVLENRIPDVAATSIDTRRVSANLIRIDGVWVLGGHVRLIDTSNQHFSGESRNRRTQGC